MPEVGEVFQEVFFVEAKPPEAHEIAAAQADAVKAIHLEHFPAPMRPLHCLAVAADTSGQKPCNTAAMQHTIGLHATVSTQH